MNASTEGLEGGEPLVHPPALAGNVASLAVDCVTEAARERARQQVRTRAFAKVGAELYLERVSNEEALIRLNIGHLSFGIGQPRNGTEAASVLRTFRDALDGLLQHAYAEGRRDDREQTLITIEEVRDHICAGGLAENAQHERSIVGPYLDAVRDNLDEASPWRRLESAPEDTHILLALSLGHHAIGWWTDETGDGRDWFYCGKVGGEIKPVAWMPLPKHPEVSSSLAAHPVRADDERAAAAKARPPSDAEPWVVADDEGLRLTFRTEDVAWRYRNEYTDRLINPTVTHEPAAATAGAGQQEEVPAAGAQEDAEPCYTESEIAEACMMAEIPDSKCESITIALQDARRAAIAAQADGAGGR